MSDLTFVTADLDGRRVFGDGNDMTAIVIQGCEGDEGWVDVVSPQKLAGTDPLRMYAKVEIVTGDG